VSQRQDFLEAIAADPDDDAPRLAFADWLEEQGDPRGEFIRVQCALAGLPPDDPRRADLARREEEIFAAQGAGWAAALLPHKCDCRKLSYWKRGFPSGGCLGVGMQYYLECIDAILRQDVVQDVAPWLNLNYDRPDVDDDAWVERLAASPRLRLVTKLDGGDSGFGPRRFGILIRSPHLTRLVDIDLFEDVIGLEGVQALCASPTPFRLKRLCLNGAINIYADEETADSVEAVRVLANSPKVAHLEYLGLYYNGLGEGAVAALVASPYLPRPLKLEFEESRFYDDPEAAEPLLERLRREFGSAGDIRR
jgi:uncharacterized protein (TIGR02996 family)